MLDSPKLVVAAVIEKDGTYLVCRRPMHKRHGGFWEFPGGKLEGDESLLDAARRELSEELGLHVSSDSGLCFSMLDEASGYMINFVRVQAEGEPSLLEHTELAWCTAQELLKIDLAPSDKQFVEYLNKQSDRY